MKEHLQDILVGGRPMTKLELANKEIERLTELCNKYEEEHKTTFETWQKDIKENELLHSIIKEAREYIEKNKRNLFLDVSEDFLDHDELVDRRIGKELLEILEKVEEK